MNCSTNQFDLQCFSLRLKQARIKAKLSLDALVLKMNGIVSKQAVYKYEKGLMIPSSKVLIALSIALDTPIDYFTRPINNEIQNIELAFRKTSNIKTKELDALRINIKDNIERYFEIEQILGVETNEIHFPAINETIYNKSQVEEYARNLRKEWKIGNQPIFNATSLLESKGIKVIYCQGPVGFDGVSGIVDNSHFIIALSANSNIIERQRFTAFHELGHLILGLHFDKSLSSKEIEKLCHAFASEFLLPSEQLHLIFDNKVKLYLKELISIQQTYGVSIDAIMHKLCGLQIISDQHYRSYCVKKNTTEQIKKIVETSRFTETSSSRLEDMVYNALSSNLINSSKAADLLGISVEALDQTLTS